jgi:hypothetical protein
VPHTQFRLQTPCQANGTSCGCVDAPKPPAGGGAGGGTGGSAGGGTGTPTQPTNPTTPPPTPVPGGSVIPDTGTARKAVGWLDAIIRGYQIIRRM